MKPFVFVSRPLPGDGILAPLHEVAEVQVGSAPALRPEGIPKEDRERMRGLLCLLTDSIDEPFLQVFPNLQVISSCSVGVDHIDVAAATRRGIPIGHTPDVLTETTAELTFALMLAASRRVVEADRFLREGCWTPERRWEPDLLLGQDLHGATLGILGLGPIGQAVAGRAQAFGMEVLAWSRTKREIAGISQVSLDELYSRADFISVHLALTPETRDLVDARALARVKPGTILVNTARGGIVDENALVESLQSGRLAAAGLDVFEQEPIPAGHPLRSLKNTVLTPHIGSASKRTRARMAALSVENLVAGLQGIPMRHCVNPEVQS